MSKPGDASSVPATQNTPPVLAAIGAKTVAEGVLLSFTLSASDSDGDNVSFSVSGAPSGASLSGAVFSWTPNFTQSGTYNLTFTANDGQGDTDSETITITVNDVNRAPELSAIGAKTVAEGVLLSFTLSASDSDGDNVSFSVSGAPTGASLSGAVFSWTPNFTQSGTYNLTFTTNDGQGDTDSETITITVNDVNPAPELSAIGDKTVAEGVLLSFTLSASDDDGDNVSFSVSGAPSGASLSGAVFSWTPNFTQSGTYNLTFTANDGQGDTDSETITITVNDVNRAPELSAIGDKTVAEGVLLSFDLSVIDDDEDDVTFSVSGQPEGAVLSGSTFSWTPGFDQSGTYDVTFTADDGQGDTDSETITITVGDANRAPELSAIGDQIVGEAETLNLTLAATDPDEDEVSFSVTEAPAGASLTDASFVWTPSFDQSGSYTLTFTATDGRDGIDSEQITITVEDRTPPSGPVAIDFDLLPGDQGRRVTGSAAVEQIYSCELHITDAPEIDQWRVEVEFDPSKLRYADGSFRPGEFLLAMDATAVGEAGLVSVSVSAADANSGSGDLGVLSFDILEGFGDSADLAVVEVELSREGSIVDSQIVLSVATIVSEPVAGILTGDFDGSGRVDFRDFFLFVDSFTSPSPLFDLNRDAVLDLDDFFVFSDHFGDEAE